MNIFLKIEETVQKQFPFVVYRKPNASLVKGWFQKNNDLITSENYKESGFVFAPFNSSKDAIIIPEKQSNLYEEEININNQFIDNTSHTPDFSSEESHIQLVEKGIEAINNQQFKKVVLSRKEKVEVSNFNLVETFQKLLYNYPTAFVYVWYHPKVGLWLGATPETLVSIQNNQFTTMSLAGTQVYNGTINNVIWQPKEIEEQQFVTDYITNKLSRLCSEITTSETETIKAGNLLHIRTIISGKLSTDYSTLINTLHPTPAVCGLPLETSKQFILHNENYNRSFYTGFLGELNLNSNENTSSELFVNLRCMEVTDNTIFIYVGGGVTKDSNPKKEWAETVAKTTTMKRVL